MLDFIKPSSSIIFASLSTAEIYLDCANEYPQTDLPKVNEQIQHQ